MGYGEEMKILVCSWNYPPVVGGIEQVSQQIAEGLHALGHQVTVLAAALPEGARETEGGTEVSRAAKKGIPRFLLHAVREGARRIRKERPDWIFCTSLTSAPAGWVLSRRFRVPYAVVAYGSDLVLQSKVYQMAIRPLLRGARLVFPISRRTTDLLLGKGVKEERVRLVCPGVVPPAAGSGAGEASEKIRGLAAAAAGKPVLLSVGRLVKRKGVLEFIRDVMPRVRAEIPDAQYWVVGGEPGASLIHHERIGSALEETIRATGQEDSVRLLGRLPEADLAAVYAAAKLFVFPCLDLPHDIEGFGIVVLEAALRRVPAVATRCGGIPDAVEEGVTGELVPPGNPGAMAEAIVRLLRQPERLAAMGEAGERRAREVFAWSAVAGRYAAALEEELAK
jgi:phosphatidylinositol alpha-1,6-mannosyltransferase